MPAAVPKDLRARRVALKIPHSVMAIGLGLSSSDILAIEEEQALGDGHESERAEFYAYWLDWLARLTREQRDEQIAFARAGKRFR